MATEKYLTLAELNAALPKSTAEKFKIVNMNKRTSTRFLHAKYGNIDLKTLKLEQAESLVKKGADFIERVAKKSKED